VKRNERDARWGKRRLVAGVTHDESERVHLDGIERGGGGAFRRDDGGLGASDESEAQRADFQGATERSELCVGGATRGHPNYPL
jgi:hypothetical protein